jgi:hypothetical protein
MLVWLLIALAFTLVVGGYLLFVYLSALTDFKMTPRKPMFLCNKHGAISRENVITFLGVEYCPRCYNDSLRVAERI